MKKGNRDGKIMDGQTYDSVLPEAYAKVKHQRDQVVAGFNKLKERQRELEAELAELRAAAQDIIYVNDHCKPTSAAWLRLKDLV